MSKKQKHHYIPEFYLKRWVNTDGRLIEYCRRHKNKIYARPTFPGGTGYSAGLYSIPNAPPHIENIFEKSFLSVADGLAARSLDIMLTEHYVPTGMEKVAWTRFLMSLLYRTPEGVARSMEMVRKYYEEDSLEDLRKVYSQTKLPEDPDTPEEYLKLHSAGMTRRTTIYHLLDIIESERVRDKIMHMQWHLGRIEGLKHPLLTSDRPIIMTNGIGHNYSHIVIPLSPKHVFFAANTDEQANKIKALTKNGEIGFRINDQIVRQARKFVYGLDSGQLRFVANRLGQKVPCSPFE